MCEKKGLNNIKESCLILIISVYQEVNCYFKNIYNKKNSRCKINRYTLPDLYVHHNSLQIINILWDYTHSYLTLLLIAKQG